MWTCPFCGESEPLEFQRGHIKSCKVTPKADPPKASEVPVFAGGYDRMMKNAPQIVKDDAEGDLWDEGLLY